jgi:hypothetical protein
MLFLSSPKGMGIAPIFELSVVNESFLSLLFLPRLRGFGTNESQPQDAVDNCAVVAPLTAASPPARWKQGHDGSPHFLRQLATSNHPASFVPFASSTRVAHPIRFVRQALTPMWPGRVQ